jgi:hypothetical protein
MTTAILFSFIEKNYTFTQGCAVFQLMAQPLSIPDLQNATIKKFKPVSRVGSNEKATPRAAIKMLLAGIDGELVCSALLSTKGALRK